MGARWGKNLKCQDFDVKKITFCQNPDYLILKKKLANFQEKSEKLQDLQKKTKNPRKNWKKLGNFWKYWKKFEKSLKKFENQIWNFFQTFFIVFSFFSRFSSFSHFFRQTDFYLPLCGRERPNWWIVCVFLATWRTLLDKTEPAQCQLAGLITTAAEFSPASWHCAGSALTLWVQHNDSSQDWFCRAQDWASTMPARRTDSAEHKAERSTMPELKVQDTLTDVSEHTLVLDLRINVLEQSGHR